MDIFYSDAAVFGGKVTAGCQPEMVPSAVSSSMPGEFLPVENAEGGDDANLEWLSMFMEDCLSATPNYMTSSQPHPPPPTTTTTTVSTAAAAIAATTPNPPPQLTIQPFLHDSSVLSKARTKRRKFPQRTHHQAFHVVHSDPPLLHQTHWLADSELIFPKMEHQVKKPPSPPPSPSPSPSPSRSPPPPPPSALAGGGDEKMGKEGSQGGQQPRRCTHCLSHKTPQWRAGPEGPKTLCNACGVRFKSGRLHPEYRPAKSPTFVSYKHSNSHKKVMEMRMALLPSHSK